MHAIVNRMDNSIHRFTIFCFVVFCEKTETSLSIVLTTSSLEKTKEIVYY
jgi:hypothetical protein